MFIIYDVTHDSTRHQAVLIMIGLIKIHILSILRLFQMLYEKKKKNQYNCAL
jgi:hypothetical protein